MSSDTVIEPESKLVEKKVFSRFSILRDEVSCDEDKYATTRPDGQLTHVVCSEHQTDTANQKMTQQNFQADFLTPAPPDTTSTTSKADFYQVGTFPNSSSHLYKGAAIRLRAELPSLLSL